MMAKTNSMTAEDILALADYIILPDDDAFKELAKTHKLNPEQLLALTRTLTDTIAQIKRHAARQQDMPDPETINGRAKIILDLLNKLSTQITKGRSTLEYIQVPENMGSLGSMLSFEAIKEMNPNIQFEPDVSDFVAQQTSMNLPTSLIELEYQFAQPKLIFDLANRADILIFLIGKMQDQFEGYVAEIPKNKGGAPSNWVRDHILFNLACDAPLIIGRRPTPSVNAPFEKLCADVLSALGLEIGDHTTAIARMLKKYGSKVNF